MPCKQYRLINKDNTKIAAYCGRTLDGVARNSHLRSDNYFYYNCLTGGAAGCLQGGSMQKKEETKPYTHTHAPLGDDTSLIQQ